MPKPKVEYTPIRPKRGGLVHATSMRRPQHTVCGKKFVSWVVALRPLTCQDCKRLVYLPVKK